MSYFAPVKINDQMTLLFSDEDTDFKSHHYAFHVSDAEFDAIFDRIKAAGLAYGSDPSHLDNGKLNAWGGGRGVYFTDPDGHVLELMTVPQWACLIRLSRPPTSRSCRTARLAPR